MFFPVVSVDQDAPIREARDILTKYNINSLPVTSGHQVTGIITRQIVEKAVFHRLEELSVRST